VRRRCWLKKRRRKRRKQRKQRLWTRQGWEYAVSHDSTICYKRCRKKNQTKLLRRRPRRGEMGGRKEGKKKTQERLRDLQNWTHTHTHTHRRRKKTTNHKNHILTPKHYT
jgi:hypothetical protein